ncbi:MAG: response regulator [Kordiimonadaceae bacterium]|nr:response regulator [Kordiimonadaceae bacterium]
MTKILVVEDEAGVREDIVEVLEMEGFDIAEACDGLEGIEKAIEFLPDLIISDVSMPRLDGYGFFEKLHDEHPDVSTVPFLFLTAFADKEAELKGRAFGASDYLTKPIDFELLVARIRGQLVTATKVNRRINDRLQSLLAKKPQTREALSEIDEEQVLDDLLQRYQAVIENASEPLSSLQNVQSVRFSFKTPTDAKNTAIVLSHACPDSDVAALGFVELFVNAVEHGNLGLSYADKSKLLEGGGWAEEIESRLESAPYNDRHVEVVLTRNKTELRLEVIDQGEGFNWQNFLELDPLRAGDLHGRGIAFAKALSFTTLRYRGNGNHAIATIEL